MSKLSIEQKTIEALFNDKKSDFLIPDYQRPYAWGEEECQTLWDDIFAFAFPNNNCDKFNKDEEYYLGSIVTYKTDNGSKLEVIDGQQRLTTLMLLLRAFYVKFGKMQDENSKLTKERISKCIWKTNEFGKPIEDELKIDSDVATDEHKEEFLKILKSGNVDKSYKSNYALNYGFFQKQIDDFLSEYPSYFSCLPARILGNCILLPIEADSRETALRIFSTLNNRGLPLSDADIFKAEFYKFYSDKDARKKKFFIEDWKSLEKCCGESFTRSTGSPMNELFTNYMYYERAKKDIKSSTTEALRTFYEKDNYRLLKCEETFENLKCLSEFWKDIYGKNEENERCFSADILRKFFILKYAPNGMWTYFVSVYFMHNKDNTGKLNNNKFGEFLSKIIAFIWTYAITNPGVNALRTPVYAEMVNIVKDKPVTFVDHKFDLDILKGCFDNHSFSNGRPITKSMLAWWAFNSTEQDLPKDKNVSFDIEHIFSKKRQEIDRSLSNDRNMESLGNKSLLEQNINIRASDYKFADKTKYYLGYGKKVGTIVKELITMSKNKTDFTEKDIEERNRRIINGFLSFLKDNDLIKGVVV